MTRHGDHSPPNAGDAPVRAHRWLWLVLVGVIMALGHAILLRRVWSHLPSWGVLVSGGVVALVAVKHVGLLALLRRRRRRRRKPPS